MLVYPIIVIICWGPITVGNLLFMFGVINDGAVNYWLELLTRLQVVLTALIYVFSKGVMQEAKKSVF